MADKDLSKWQEEKEQWVQEREELYSAIDMEYAEVERYMVSLIKEAEKKGATIFVGDIATKINKKFKTEFSPRKIGVILHDNLNVRTRIVRDGLRTGRAIISRKQMISSPEEKDSKDTEETDVVS